jgi:hypothetical protein
MADDTQQSTPERKSESATRITHETPVRVTDGDVAVVLSKIHTPKGERLEIADPDSERTVRLDAIQIESLSWQDQAFFAGLVAESSVPAAETSAEGPAPDGERIRIANEYAEAQVLVSRAGGAAVIQSEPLHHDCAVGPRHLAALLEVDHTLFSELLAQPYGPLTETE